MVCAHTSVYRPRGYRYWPASVPPSPSLSRPQPAPEARMRRTRDLHRMKMANATTETRPPRTEAQYPRAEWPRARLPAPLPPGAAGRWTGALQLSQHPQRSPLVPPAPGRGAQLNPQPHTIPSGPTSPSTLPPLSREWMWNGVSSSFTPDLQPSVGSTTRSPSSFSKPL